MKIIDAPKYTEKKGIFQDFFSPFPFTPLIQAHKILGDCCLYSPNIMVHDIDSIQLIIDDNKIGIRH